MFGERATGIAVLAIVRWMLRLGFAALVLGVAAVAGVYYYFAPGLPDHKQLTDYQPAMTTRLYTGDGRLLAEYAKEKRAFVPAAQMPKRLIYAFVAAEDQRFFWHPGVDPIGISRALLTNLQHPGRRPEGASSITQQVAKNFLVGNETTIRRKIREAILAIRIESAFTKEHILELYLNQIYLGGGNYGVAAAALNYFNKSLDELTLSEMAYLAALPKSPNRYSITRNAKGAHDRRDYVLGRMHEDGYITAEELRAAKEERLTLRKRAAPEFAQAEFFTEEVRRNLLAAYGEKGVYEGGLTVRTSVDFEIQRMADEALREGLVDYDRRHGWRGVKDKLPSIDDWQHALPRYLEKHPFAGLKTWRPAVVLGYTNAGAKIGLEDGSEGVIPHGDMAGRVRPVSAGDIVAVEPRQKPAGTFSLRQVPAVDGAVVVMDVQTGRILAMSGGFSYQRSQYNRATQAMRQPGSSFKPFVYLAGLNAGMTPSTLVLDAPIELPGGPGQAPWRPQNYGGGSAGGPMTLRQGIEQSRNLMTVRLARSIGMDKVAAVAKQFGVDDNLKPYLPMAIGAGETTLLRMTTAYAMLANGARRITPSLIDRVQDRDGRTIFRHDPRTCVGCDTTTAAADKIPTVVDRRQPFFDPASTYQIVHIMQGVTVRGTAARLAKLGRPIAGKTGTTNDSRDVWFIGATPEYVIGVFVGFDDPKTLGGRETGGSVSLPIYERVARQLYKDKAPTPFRIPPGLRLMRVNLADGMPAPGDPSAIWEVFKPGTEPTGYDYRVVDGMSRFVPGGGPGSDEPVDPNAGMPPAWSIDPSADGGDPTLPPGTIPPPPRPGRPTLTGTGETY
ncbi:penicillin-binding protein 1A [Reyranella sp. CPCC 100927]|uniref:penicillin-binding protein 1A n=1 Tax=Reyranella sp. CPCC 100927 TaxID=2599616 RepID=UPI0011B7CD9C|nr:penicillin-binding protein 1A [Reyranella sp. CPCC 100927]TWT00693.1 penicillin-binding protein 1A [Reyranella sp. CPCC 100927]